MKDVWHLSHDEDDDDDDGNLALIFQVAFALKIIYKLLSLQGTVVIGICASFFVLNEKKVFY